MSGEGSPRKIRGPANYTALVFLFVTAAVLLSAASVQAQGSVTWEQTQGPSGGKVNVLLISRSDPSTIYAGVDGGIYVSRDSGGTWQCSSGGLPEGQAVWALAMNPTASHVLYAGTYAGVYHSTNGGKTWSQANAGLTRKLVFSLAVNPTNPSVIYAGTDARVFKSINGGERWTVSSSGLPEGAIWSLLVDCATSDVLYAGSDSGVFKSVDGGQQWQRASDGMPDGLRVQALVMDRHLPCVLYAATEVGVYRSMDAAGTWQATATGLGENAIHSLAVDPNDSNILYAAVGTRGVWQSTNRGETWERMDGRIRELVLALVVHPTQPQLLYAGTGRGVYRYSGADQCWESSSQGLINTAVQQLVAVPGRLGHLYATTGLDVYRTVDGGQTWSPVNAEFARPNVLALAVDPLFPDVLYAGTWYSEVYRSGDGGRTWWAVSTGLADDAQINTLVVQRAAEPRSDGHSGVLYAGTNGAGVFTSTDGGLHWLAVNIGLDDLRVQVLALVSSGAGTLYAGTGSGIYRLDLGEGTEPRELRWLAAQRGLPQDEIRHIVVDARSPDVIYASGATRTGAVYRSADGGANWEVVGEETLPTDIQVQALAVNSSGYRSSTLYAGTGDGVFCSKDEGSSWRAVNDGLPTCANVLALLVDAEDSCLYASVRGSGVYKSISAGAPPLPWPLVGGAIMGLGAAVLVVILHRRQWALHSSEYVQDRVFERNWPVWRKEIERILQSQNVVKADMLNRVPDALRARALQQYMQEHRDDDLVFRQKPAMLEPANSFRVWDFVQNWRAAQTRLNSAAAFEPVVSRIADQLCHLLGFTLINHRSYKYLHAYVLKSPALRLRMPPTFPIVFAQKRDLGEEGVNDLRGILDILNISSYLALLVVPDTKKPGSEQGGLKAHLKSLARIADEDLIVLDLNDLYHIFVAREPQKRFVKILLDQIDLTVVSPYITVGPVPEHMFFGRDYELKTIIRTIRDNSFAVVGGRKIGKTSILAKLHRLFTDATDHHSLYLDCQTVRDYRGFCDAAETMWGLSLSDCTPKHFMRGVVDMKQKRGEQLLVILLDKVDALLKYDTANEERLFKVMRALSQQDYCRFVFCGERIQSASPHDSGSAFSNFCSTIRLSYLNPRATGRIVLEPMREMGIGFEDAGKLVQGVISLSACHPNIVQYICQELIALVNTRDDRVITLDDVDTVGNSSQFGEYLVEVMWGSATPFERLITLLLLDRPGATCAGIESLLREQGVAVSTAAIKQALDALELWSVLYRKDHEYYFAAPVFPAVITATQDVESLIEEMAQDLPTVA